MTAACLTCGRALGVYTVGHCSAACAACWDDSPPSEMERAVLARIACECGASGEHECDPALVRMDGEEMQPIEEER